MERRKRQQASIRVGKDPLGLNLESIAEPLQRWYLIGRGNPYFDDEVTEVREHLGVPSYGFAEHADYDAWLAESGRRHGHVERESVVIGTIYVKSHELLQRALGRNRPLAEAFAAPAPCCDTDPLHVAACHLAERFGVDLCEGEPGFQGVERTIAGYVLVHRWPEKRSAAGLSIVHEDDYVDSRTGKRVVGREGRKLLGLKARAGQGRMLPIRYEWWRLRQMGKENGVIADWTEHEYGQWYDERSIARGIDEVERLLRPVTN